MHEEKQAQQKQGDAVKDGAVPAYLLERQQVFTSLNNLAVFNLVFNMPA